MHKCMHGAMVLLLGAIGACTPPPPGPRSPEIGPHGVVFRLHAPAARMVQVSGSWDGNSALRGRDWTRFTRVGRMQDDDRDGVWECTVPLGPGRYDYSFWVDGRFQEVDPQNPERAPDGRGGVVSRLVVP